MNNPISKCCKRPAKEESGIAYICSNCNKPCEVEEKFKYSDCDEIIEDESCGHVCTSECRRSGCNCECGEYHISEKIKVTKHEKGYDACWDSVHGVGKTHIEALKGLHYMMNFFNGTIEDPTPLPVHKEDIEFEDSCDDPKCPCEKCEHCGGTGEVTTMESVYPNEPHTAPIGSRKCVCQMREPDDSIDE